jgi:hypothetical protein
MKKLSVLLSMACVIIFTSCEKVVGEGTLVTETRTTSAFNGIESEISGNVIYVQGNDYKVELTAQQNILNIMETPVLHNKVVVRFKNNVRVKEHEQITIKVTAPAVSSIGLSGSGNISVLNPLNGTDFDFHLSGSGDMNLPTITCNSLETSISGSGSIIIAGGTATAEHFKISGSGDIDARNLLAKTASVTTSGSGTVRLSASEKLDVKIEGSGSVYYWGTPIISTDVSGSGRIIHQ